MIWIYVLIFIGSCFVLIKSGSWVIKSLVRIAKDLQWSEFLVTFCLMALATSLPELFIGLNSALHKLSQLSFGNIIGANILNLTLITALVVFMGKGLKIERERGFKLLNNINKTIVEVNYNYIISDAEIIKDRHIMRAFSEKEITEFIVNNGFSICSIYSNTLKEPYSPTSNSIVIHFEKD